MWPLGSYFLSSIFLPIKLTAEACGASETDAGDASRGRDSVKRPGAMRVEQLENNKSWAPGKVDSRALQEHRRQTLKP